jgi:hypothetical protein
MMRLFRVVTLKGASLVARFYNTYAETSAQFESTIKQAGRKPQR